MALWLALLQNLWHTQQGRSIGDYEQHRTSSQTATKPKLRCVTAPATSPEPARQHPDASMAACGKGSSTKLSTHRPAPSDRPKATAATPLSICIAAHKQPQLSCIHTHVASISAHGLQHRICFTADTGRRLRLASLETITPGAISKWGAIWFEALGPINQAAAVNWRVQTDTLPAPW